MRIQSQASGKVEDRDPREGLWYHGLTWQGEIGTLALCVSPGLFEAEDHEVDMTKYPVLVEHDCHLPAA